MKVIKEESEVLGLLRINDDLFTCDTPLGTGLSYFPSVEQQFDNLEYDDLDVYERKVGYDEIKTDIFHFKTPLCKAFNEFNYLLQIDTDVLTKDIPGFKTYEGYRDDWIYEWNKGIPWVDEKPSTDNEVWKESIDNIDHVCKPFHFKSGHARWPTCNWREDGYCNKGNLPGMIQVGNKIHYQDYEWYEALEDSDRKDKALNNNAILEGSKKEEEESSEDAWSHYTPIDEW
ncbi:hypothetical protein Tco_0725237 [Tanacetum coccineum]|uniref:Uncharacterized protein n=1 Tax=Tanacetum coccineum TaxID=301880 RepID=A0ABQ4YDB3_9ASTR